ncbi:MAG: phospho-N-acetylmuramoyl-pentapeptide-transferase [Phycisphaerales bacterium]|nr:phospho-N-acetylmuramoyl-pentapeptide-transferase [Phycisphaerales bacterium]
MLYLLLNVMRDWLARNGMISGIGVLDQIQFRALAAAGLSFLFVILLGRRTIRWLVRLKIGDSGLSDAAALQAHTASKANTPTMGGLLISGAIAASTLLLADLTQFYVQLSLIVLVWLSVLGGMDDWLKLTAKARGAQSRQGLYAWEKLVFQLGLGALVGYFAYNHGITDSVHSLAHVVNLPFQKTYKGPVSGVAENLIYLDKTSFIILATLIMAGMSNAVNISDGMDGLAAGISGAVLIGLFVLALVAGSQPFAQYLLVPYIPFADELAVVAGATAGACLGFLWWNCSPAQVFMGDTGALALGGMIGYIAIIIRQEFVMLVMSGIFLLEIGSVALQVGYFKATGGKRIFKVAPFHHHLHLSGWTEQQVVARFWILSILLVVIALATVKLR